MSNTITDLTGTSWELNINPIILDNITYNINFNSFNTNFVTFLISWVSRFSLATITYANNDSIQVYSSNSDWSNQAYRTINITGGTDAINSTLISWLQANATQIIEEEQISSFNTLSVVDHTEYITLTIGENSINITKATAPSEWGGTDLTGTTWVFNNDVSLRNTWSYNLTFISDDFEFNYIEIALENFSNNLYYNSSLVFDGEMNIWVDVIFKTIEITGGTDATNSTLISWLQDNATLISW